jgi:hypothetical protein
MNNNPLEFVFNEASKNFFQYTGKKIILTRIDSNILNIWHKNWVCINTRKPPNGGWDWEYKIAHFQKNYRKYIFDFAIFDENGNLSGLALGKISRSKTNLSIYYIESSPNKLSFLKGYIFSIINLVGSEYAKLIGIKKFRLIEPVDELIEFYKSYDFEFNKKTLFGKSFCEKDIL